MKLFAISDLHLSSDNKKSMEIFGSKWSDYMNKIKENWILSVSNEDTVIIPGDISWGMYLDESIDDFKYLESLPGNKIITKGNHDYWWTTLGKLNKFLKEQNFNSIRFLHNDSILHNNILICGSRGWICPGQTGFKSEDLKIFNREIQRIRLSLESGKNKKFDKTVVVFHFPPFDKDGEVSREIEELFIEFKVDLCIYGHLHGPGHKEGFEGIKNGTEYKMVSADYLNFIPVEIMKI